MSMKVCLVSHSSLKGGGERSLLETIEAMLDRGVECSVLLPRRGPLHDDLQLRGVPAAIVPYRWWTGPENGPRWRRAARLIWNLGCAIPVYLLVRRWNPDVVYTNTLSVPSGALVAALAGKPHVWHIRELGHDHNRRVFDLGERAALRLMDRLSARILTNSRCVAERYRPAFGGGKISVVYQAVSMDDRAGAEAVPPKQGFRCVVAGSISPAKRQEEAIEAVSLLRGEGLDVELLIVGEGDREYEATLRALVERVEGGGSISLLGEVPSAIPYIESADAVVNCSRHEAFGRVTVEGMLAGRPVIGARSDGTAELIEDGVNGLLYEPGDVTGLAGILRRLVRDPAEGARIGAAARAWASGRFTRERFGDELLDGLRLALEAAP